MFAIYINRQRMIYRSLRILGGILCNEDRIVKNRRRRTRQLRRHIAIFIITSLLIVFSAITLSTFISKASESEDTLFKYYKTIEISKEKLYGI